jgi:hypothetical protein
MVRATALAVLLSLLTGPLAGIVCGLSCERHTAVAAHQHHHHHPTGAGQSANTVALQAEHVCLQADYLQPGVISATQPVFADGTARALVPVMPAVAPGDAHAISAFRSGRPPGASRPGSSTPSVLRI